MCKVIPISFKEREYLYRHSGFVLFEETELLSSLNKSVPSTGVTLIDFCTFGSIQGPIFVSFHFLVLLYQMKSFDYDQTEFSFFSDYYFVSLIVI